MNEEIINYIKSQRIATLAVEMPDGSPHGAIIHFSHMENPLGFIVLTEKSSLKCETINKSGKARASFVLGTSEEEMKTLQMDGTAEISESEEVQNAYFNKFPENRKWFGDSSAFIVFTPTWWRYTDYKSPAGKLIISSEQ